MTALELLYTLFWISFWTLGVGGTVSLVYFLLYIYKDVHFEAEFEQKFLLFSDGAILVGCVGTVFTGITIVLTWIICKILGV